MNTSYKNISRRHFFKKLRSHSLLAISAGLAACQGPSRSSDPAIEEGETEACSDLSGLSDQDLSLRENFGYVDKSPLPESQCSNCNLWIPRESDPSCGKCLLFKGPVREVGYCTSWAPQT